MSIKSMAGLALSALLLLANTPALSAQNEGEVDDSRFLSEKRIFLWDVTISMVGANNDDKGKPGWVEDRDPRHNPDYDYSSDKLGYYPLEDIFDDTRAELLKLIDDIPEGDYEIEVITYTTDLLGSCKVGSSSAKDKEIIKNWVKTNPMSLQSGGTYTGTCLEKVIDNHFEKGKINRVILLTDGYPDAKYEDERKKLTSLISEWDKGKKDTKYQNNRLVYVMLTEEAEKSEEFNEIIDGKDSSSGVEVIKSGESIAERLNFSLTGLSQSFYVNDFVQGDGLKGGQIVLGCERESGPAAKMEEIKCCFTVQDSSLLTIDQSAVSYKDGKLVVPFEFAAASRQFYLDNLPDGVGNVYVKCSVDPSCKDVVLEGADEVVVDVVVKPEPRAVISLSIK